MLLQSRNFNLLAIQIVVSISFHPPASLEWLVGLLWQEELNSRCKELYSKM